VSVNFTYLRLFSARCFEETLEILCISQLNLLDTIFVSISYKNVTYALFLEKA